GGDGGRPGGCPVREGQRYRYPFPPPPDRLPSIPQIWARTSPPNVAPAAHGRPRRPRRGRGLQATALGRRVAGRLPARGAARAAAAQRGVLGAEAARAARCAVGERPAGLRHVARRQEGARPGARQGADGADLGGGGGGVGELRVRAVRGGRAGAARAGHVLPHPARGGAAAEGVGQRPGPAQRGRARREQLLRAVPRLAARGRQAGPQPPLRRVPALLLGLRPPLLRARALHRRRQQRKERKRGPRPELSAEASAPTLVIVHLGHRQVVGYPRRSASAGMGHE
ncbi:unnamed protein product, partial [Prorocentrum cordatum]